MSERIAKLTLPNGQVFDLPVLSGTLGADVVSVSQLAKSGVFTLDPGFL